MKTLVISIGLFLYLGNGEAGVLYAYGFILSPTVGAVFMSLSTVIVAVNAQLLKRSINKKYA